MGWSAFFPIAVGLALASGLVYVLGFDRIEALVVDREAREASGR